MITVEIHTSQVVVICLGPIINACLVNVSMGMGSAGESYQ